MRAAYDALSGDMQHRLAGMVGLHGRTMAPPGYGSTRATPTSTSTRAYTEKARPAVVTHPVTWRRILFVNSAAHARLPGNGLATKPSR
jgi:alpha-ketoglutarate-dependent taurine dioxygenase